MKEKMEAEKQAKLKAEQEEQAERERQEQLRKEEEEEAERQRLEKEAEEAEQVRRQKEDKEQRKRLQKAESAKRQQEREEAERKVRIEEAARKAHSSPPVSPPKQGGRFGIFGRRREGSTASPESPSNSVKQATTSHANRDMDNIISGGGGAVLGIDAPISAVNAGDRVSCAQ